MESITLTHQDYTIGWICALEVELTAARCMLDEEHEDLSVAANDSNTYTLGRAGKHNIVIACLPEGTIGTTGAATAAANLLRSFNNIRFGLMVGIAGGAPGPPDEEDPRNDIRLGDVVVSTPLESSGGVIHYDFSVTLDGGRTVRIGHLNSPPPVVMTAVAKLRSNISRGYSIRQLWDDMLQREPDLDHKYPGHITDHLFASDYPHTTNDSHCRNCDASRIVLRQTRTKPDKPIVHYGLIGSTNQLLMSAKRRDELRQQDQIICLEMEASGLMNDFPCVVIRGICDYCDGHKNKIWQPYAAGMAAAYTKALLAVISPAAVVEQKMARDVLQAVELVSANTEITKAKVDRIATDRLYEKLPYASGATFDAAEDAHATDQRCLKGTRVALLQQIRNWATSNTTKTIFWLNGAAGTGKSTIARTVAAEFAASAQLGASFFFKRGERDRSHAHRFFTTIAVQLSQYLPAVRPFIEKAIEADPRIGESSPRRHFDELILKPLASANAETGRLVFLVIDALDECDLDAHMRLVVDLLAKIQIQSAFDIRILLTSRPELPLRLGFKNLTSNQYESLVLQEIAEAIVIEDFTIYLRHHFMRITTDHDDLPQTWPGDKNVVSLVHMALPLFIFAATICRFIADSNWSPEQQLEYLLRYKSTRMDSMDRTYEPVLARLLGSDTSRHVDLIKDFRAILGPITVLGEPLSRIALASLLRINEQSIGARLQTLHAVLNVPSRPDIPIRPHHLSFIDFLLDEKRGISNKFWIDAKIANQKVAGCCLVLLLTTKQLHKDICNLSSSGMTQQDIHNHSVSRFMTPEIQYACCYWVHHLSRGGDLSCDVQARVLQFLEERFLFWLEALSLLGRTGQSITMMHTLLSLPLADNPSSDVPLRLRLFFEDGYRFAMYNKPAIETDCLQTYASALLFAPSSSIVKHTFQSYIPARILRMPRVREYWDEKLQVLERGHKAGIECIAFSQSELLAVGDEAGFITLWDSVTGHFQQTLKGSEEDISSVLFIDDDYYLVSGSRSGTIKLWNVDSGEARQTMRTSNDTVTAVISSPEGFLVAASFNGYIEIWDTATSKVLRTIEGHSNDSQTLNPCITALAFSHHGELISASLDKTIRIWKRLSYSASHVLSGHSDGVTCIALSQGSRLLASGSYDCAIKLWDIGRGELEHTIGPIEEGLHVLSLAFSPDGNILAAGTEGRIALFETKSRNFLRTLIHGHGAIRSLAFSLSGVLAAGSDDLEITLWKPATNIKGIAGSTDHPGKLLRVVFDSSGHLLASLCDYGCVKLWLIAKEVIREVVVGTINSHQEIHYVVFSPNSHHLAFGGDTVTYFYDIASAQVDKVECGSWKGCFSPDSNKFVLGSSYKITMLHVATKELVWSIDTKTPSAIAFSMDGECLALANYDDCQIWDTSTGLCKRTLTKHHEEIRQVSLSPNNKLLAIAYDHSIKVIELVTDELKAIFEFSSRVEKLRFHPNLPYLETNLGQIKLNVSGDQIEERSSVGMDTFRLNDEWIYHNSDMLLWLPADYREGKCDVHGGLFAFGTRLKDVTFIEFFDQTNRTRMRTEASEQEITALVVKGLKDLAERNTQIPGNRVQSFDAPPQSPLI